MNDWDKALWMLEEGFTMTQVKNLEPADADAWKKLKPMLVAQRKPSKEITKERKSGQRIAMMKEAISNSKGATLTLRGEVYYPIAEVLKAHPRSMGQFYKHLNILNNDEKMIIKIRKQRLSYMRLRGDDE